MTLVKMPLRRASLPIVLAAVALAALTVSRSSAADQSAAAVPPGMQHRMLNVLDTPGFSNIGAWKVAKVHARVADVAKPQMGSTAIVISGDAQADGGKIDATAFDGSLEGCTHLSLWVNPSADSNIASVGFQVKDAQGEWLMQTVPVDWTGGRRIDIDPTAGGMKQAYAQKDQNKTVDLPLTTVHLVLFAKQPGPMSLTVDGLSALTTASADADVHLTTPDDAVSNAGQPLNLHLIAENHGDKEQAVSVHYTLQVNSQYIEKPVPDPVLGYDEALGKPATVSVDGVDKGDALLTDGSTYTGFETSWGKGYKEVVATIDLGKMRDITAVQWMAGDANWIFKADVSASTDGKSYQPVAGAQEVDLHKKWGGPHAFPWKQPVSARYLRFRFHNDGKSVNVMRLPVTISVYDGIANDDVSIPQVGQTILTADAQATIGARDFGELVIAGNKPLEPGAYLLGMVSNTSGKQQTSWMPLLVRPVDTVDPDRARRFGINSSQIEYAQSMRDCGFGWVRFENAKWMMYMPSPDHYAFDGSVGPWHVNMNDIFATYNKLGMDVLPYVFQPPAWATSAQPDVTKNRAGYPPKNVADYGEAIFQLVARFGTAKVDPSLLKTIDHQSGLNLIQAVELWNEPNLNAPSWGPFVGTMSQYFDVMRAGVEGARRADPSLPVSAAGLAGIKLDVVGLLAEHHYPDGKTPLDLVDIVNVHFYSGRQDPETSGWDPNVDRDRAPGGTSTYPEQLEDLVAWRDRLKPTAQIWLTETGNDVGGPIGLDERHQAAKLPRDLMLALASGIDKAFIYREAGSTPSQHAGSGLLRNDGTMRPSWLTVATMIRQLQGFDGRALRLPSADPNVWIFLWHDGDRRVVSAWTIGDPGNLGIDMGKATAVDAFGHSVPTATTADLQLGYFPIYINISEPSAALSDLVAKAEMTAKQRAETRQRLAKLTMYLFDFGSPEHVGMLNGFGLPRRFTAVGKDRVWDSKLGYGFASPAAGQDDRGWISDPLERDGCRVGKDDPFRIQLAPGEYTLRIRATALNANQPIDVIVKSANQSQTHTITPDASIAKFAITAGGEPVEISLSNWGIMRWITAIPAAAAPQH